jgi:hypothetical protein
MRIRLHGTTFGCFFNPIGYSCGMELSTEYEYQHPHPYHREVFSGSHISLGGVKYAAVAVACTLLAEKIKTPEQRYLILAAIGALIGAMDTAWRDHVKAQRQECRERAYARG